MRSIFQFRKSNTMERFQRDNSLSSTTHASVCSTAIIAPELSQERKKLVELYTENNNAVRPGFRLQTKPFALRGR